jgi:hypothetical protein
MRPGTPEARPADPQEPKPHNHGRMYRCKMVPFKGATEYGEWFATELEVQTAMRSLVRKLGTRYYCETRKTTCPECEAGEGEKVISVL